ncbi:hypothetical protein CNY89_09480, partial [Amaricoccus sp. HAR-UPW-R2A-40]
VDSMQDIRGEMLSTMKRIGMKVDKHHHEVASPPRASARAMSMSGAKRVMDPCDAPPLRLASHPRPERRRGVEKVSRPSTWLGRSR